MEGMNLPRAFAVGVLGLLGVWGQAPEPDPGRGVAYAPVFDLVRLVNGWWAMEQNRLVALNPDQAQQALPLLRSLAEPPHLSLEMAQQTRFALEALLTPAQQQWWSAYQQAQQQAFQRWSAKVRTLGPVNLYAYTVPGYWSMLQEIGTGQPFNPFRRPPNASTLARLIARLEGR